MKIVTWNAHMGFRNKQKDLVERLNPDIAFIQECEDPDKYPGAFPDSLFPFRLWKGDNKDKGIAVFSKYKITEIEDKSPSSKFFLPVEINGMFFIGIWAVNDRDYPQNRYIGQVWNIINQYKELLNNEIIILGDFNWNIFWDNKQWSTLIADFRDVNAMLNKVDIVSVYHNYLKEDFGRETNPTYFHLFNEKKPFHTDYIYLKKNTLDSIKDFSVGKYKEWDSDHMPLFVEM
ncbi:MAG: endonuclease/exonuclease/phosphatase family protein [Candidatus Methanoperedens sp.]|nr:endonuclease/exonuclease/phosphatase family protein [Candidatus Methanoperedens sp.]